MPSSGQRINRLGVPADLHEHQGRGGEDGRAVLSSRLVIQTADAITRSDGPSVSVSLSLSVSVSHSLFSTLRVTSTTHKVCPSQQLLIRSAIFSAEEKRFNWGKKNPPSANAKSVWLNIVEARNSKGYIKIYNHRHYTELEICLENSHLY